MIPSSPRWLRHLVVLAASGVLLLTTLPSAPTTAAATAPVVRGYLTTPDLKHTFERIADRHLGAGPPSADTERIVVTENQRGQKITAGFGVAMTDTSAWLLAKKLGPRRRANVLRKLFSTDRGIGLSFLRVPIGGSDFIVSRTPYTYDDMPRGSADTGLKNFSVAHDRAYIFPMIRQALRINPGIRTMANPWSPPAWMKFDMELVSTTPLGTVQPRYYNAYARYLVKSVQAFRANGVPIRYVGVQNEPYTALVGALAQIPTAFMTGLDEARLIGQYLVPGLRRAGLSPRIIGYDDAFQRSETFIPLLMAFAGSHVSALGYHCYASDSSSMKLEAALFPGVEQLQTECASNLSNHEPAQMMIRNLRNGANGVQLWNAVLDQHNGPKIGTGCVGLPGSPNAGKDCIAPVTVDTRNGTYRLTSDYWALAHFSKFIRRGAVRISSTSATCFVSPLPTPPCGVETVAFQNTDGSRVLVATAHDGRSHKISIVDRDRSFDAVIPDGGTITFVW